MQNRIRLLGFKNPVEKDMKYTRENRDTLHYKRQYGIGDLFVLFRKINLKWCKLSMYSYV